jgi:hypothetical protein
MLPEGEIFFRATAPLRLLNSGTGAHRWRWWSKKTPSDYNGRGDKTV